MTSKEYIEAHLPEIIEDLRSLVKYPSVYDTDQKPFGSQNRLVLDHFIKMMDKIGLKTKNLDYYAGYGEIGSGEKLIGILGHLDVVPAGKGWDYDPYDVTVKDDILYGRGVSDDKGGVIANYWALKYLIEHNYQFKKRFRLIVGSNEETGFGCIKHYVKKEGHIDAGYTPDGHWPGIYGEKGGLHGHLLKDTNIINIKGGSATNAVCNYVELEVEKNSLDITKLKEYLVNQKLKHEIIETDTIKLIVEGKAAHASTPHLGINAISYSLLALDYAGYQDQFVSSYNKLIGLNLHGEGTCLALKDDFGDLTLNVGVIEKVNQKVNFSIDIRYPVTYKPETVEKLFKDSFVQDFEITDLKVGKPLFVDPNNKMIKTLLDAYQSVSKDYENTMQVIGGGTYAKGINNCIAFGPEFPGDDNHIHDKNEKLAISDLKKNIEIYIQAIINLNEME